MTAVILNLKVEMNLNQLVYFDEKYFTDETISIGKNVWFCLGHASDFTEGFNIVKPWNFEVLFLKQENNFQAFLNVCPHRGLSFTSEDVCKERFSIKCKYHGLQFGADGEALKELYNFEKESKFKLQKMNVGLCGKFIYVSFQKKITVKEYLFEHFDILEKYSLSIGKKILIRNIEVGVNWKLQMENFLDCLHTLWVHHDTIGRRQKLKLGNDYLYKISGNTSSLYSAGSSLSESTLNVYTKRSPNRKFISGGYEHVHCFPNFNIATDQGFYFVNIVVLPVSVDKCTLNLSLYLPDGSEFSPSHVAYVEAAIMKIIGEDIATVQNFNRGVSYLESNLQYSGLEERTEHFVKNCLKYKTKS